MRGGAQLRESDVSLIGRLLRPFTNPRAKAEDKPKAGSQAKAPAAQPDEYAVRIAALVRETADATTVSVERVDGKPIVHTPGQFLMLRFDLPSGPVSRAYSICTAPGQGGVSVTVKRIAGGLVSTHVVERAAVGDVLHARGPMGRFLAPETAKSLFFIAGGSGITPIMSQIRQRLATGDQTPLTLLYGNRSEADIIFRNELEAIVAQYPQLRVQHVLSDGNGELTAVRGLLDEATVAAQLAALVPEPGAVDAFMMCGPEPMMVAARKALLAHGVGESTIHEERFSASALAAVDGDPQGDTEITFVHEGQTRSVVVEAGETLLDAAQRLNLPVDFSCMAGQCGTCMVKLESGDVRMDEPNCLSASERAEGLILACSSRPRGPLCISTVKPRF
jgi:ferredoxin-NADP reductase